MTARSLVRRVPRLVCCALVLLLAGFAFEDGRHSAHHLSDDDTASCAIAGSAGHLPVLGSFPVVAAPFTETIGPIAAEAVPSAASVRALGFEHGRAPPHSLSA